MLNGTGSSGVPGWAMPIIDRFWTPESDFRSNLTRSWFSAQLEAMPAEMHVRFVEAVESKGCLVTCSEFTMVPTKAGFKQKFSIPLKDAIEHGVPLGA